MNDSPTFKPGDRVMIGQDPALFIGDFPGRWDMVVIQPMGMLPIGVNRADIRRDDAGILLANQTQRFVNQN